MKRTYAQIDLDGRARSASDQDFIEGCRERPGTAAAVMLSTG
ncbi:hypothetical protein [Aminobacter sp. HY435]|nr:hypothetical protein [Aminobacter sp. HY435]